MGKDGKVAGLGSGNPQQDMLDFAYLLYNSGYEPKMSIENEPYN